MHYEIPQLRCPKCFDDDLCESKIKLEAYAHDEDILVTCNACDFKWTEVEMNPSDFF
jgi:DNA-directed RNA polymerase subunit M/transcription elongation factor TFIIS